MQAPANHSRQRNHQQGQALAHGVRSGSESLSEITPRNPGERYSFFFRAWSFSRMKLRTMEELQALVTLTENQFFRIKFLDPKMPGYKARPDELKAAQSAVAVIR